MKKTKEASGWRKAILSLTTLLITIISIAQSNDTTILGKSNLVKAGFVRPKIDTLTLFDEKPVAKYKTRSDTLVVADVKYIKAGNMIIEKSVLEKAIVVLSEKDLNDLFNQLQEFSAKCANPITEWLMRIFKIEVVRKSPPNQ